MWLDALSPYPWIQGDGLDYQRHRPEETVLHRTLQAHWRSFLGDISGGDGGGAGLPRFIVDEVEAYLKRGILAHGKKARLLGARA